MFKIESITVNGFWGDFCVKSNFRDDVNIIIGKNGTGKTTFMNIMHAVLSVDVEALSENYFKTVEINLSNGRRKRKIKAERFDNDDAPFSIIEYKISNRKFSATLVSNEEPRLLSPTMRRRLTEEVQKIKNELGRMVSLASLSVYRLGGDVDPDFRDRGQKRIMSPVDQRLMNLTLRLTKYQLELSNEARKVSSDLQRDVLVSILYSKNANSLNRGYSLEFDRREEEQRLLIAYKHLGVINADVTRKIQEHVNAVAEAVNKLKSVTANNSVIDGEFDFSALESFGRARAVVDLSLNAEAGIKKIFSQIDLFLQILKKFITDKEFKFESGELVVAGRGEVALSKLSSGEKQLLILFIEALLQKRRPYIFLADEPELSLHISWQRNIISTIRQLNPEAQIIVATHSPEVAGRYRGAIIDMGSIRRD